MKLIRCMALIMTLFCYLQILQAAENKNVLFLNKTPYEYTVTLCAGTTELLKCTAGSYGVIGLGVNFFGFGSGEIQTELPVTLETLKEYVAQNDNLYCKAFPEPVIMPLTKGAIGVCTAHCDLRKDVLDAYDLKAHKMVLVANSACDKYLSIEKQNL